MYDCDSKHKELREFYHNMKEMPKMDGDAEISTSLYFTDLNRSLKTQLSTELLVGINEDHCVHAPLIL